MSHGLEPRTQLGPSHAPSHPQPQQSSRVATVDTPFPQTRNQRLLPSSTAGKWPSWDPNPDLPDPRVKPCTPPSGAADPTPKLSISPPGPGQLPRVHTQCHSPATEPGHDPCHPQALLWGHAAGERGTDGVAGGGCPGAASPEPSVLPGHREMPSRRVMPFEPLIHHTTPLPYF